MFLITNLKAILRFILSLSKFEGNFWEEIVIFEVDLKYLDFSETILGLEGI